MTLLLLKVDAALILFLGFFSVLALALLSLRKSVDKDVENEDSEPEKACEPTGSSRVFIETEVEFPSKNYTQGENIQKAPIQLQKESIQLELYEKQPSENSKKTSTKKSKAKNV